MTTREVDARGLAVRTRTRRGGMRRSAAPGAPGTPETDAAAVRMRAGCPAARQGVGGLGGDGAVIDDSALASVLEGAVVERRSMRRRVWIPYIRAVDVMAVDRLAMPGRLSLRTCDGRWLGGTSGVSGPSESDAGGRRARPVATAVERREICDCDGVVGWDPAAGVGRRHRRRHSASGGRGGPGRGKRKKHFHRKTRPQPREERRSTDCQATAPELSARGLVCQSCKEELVRSRGLEPPRVAPLPPQGSASTNSATTAHVRKSPVGGGV